MCLQGLHERQSQWTIPDPVLRSNMKDAIAQDFLPQYRVSSGNAAYAGLPLCAVL